MKSFSGGAKIKARLAEIAKMASKGELLRVGFLENATYSDGTSVAMVAAVQEFGGTVTVPEHEQSVFRKVSANGDRFLRGGKFVKRSQANFESAHMVPAHTITIPPRPYFRSMIARESKHWGDDLARNLKTKNYDAHQALNLTGADIAGQLQESIITFSSPPNAPSTIAKKGVDNPLIDSGNMLNSVDWEVE